MDLIDIHRTLHHKGVKYTFFANTHGSFSKIDHIVGHKTNSTNSRKLNHIKHLLRSQWLETRNQTQEKTQKHSNTWKLNSMILNNKWVNNANKEEIK